MTVLRGGRALQIDVPVASIRTRLVSALNGAYLSYFVYRLVVFLYATWVLRGFMSTNAGSLNSDAFNAQPLVIRRADKKRQRTGRTGSGQRAVFHVGSPLFAALDRQALSDNHEYGHHKIHQGDWSRQRRCAAT